jgi:hypothetical protein
MAGTARCTVRARARRNERVKNRNTSKSQRRRCAIFVELQTKMFSSSVGVTSGQDMPLLRSLGLLFDAGGYKDAAPTALGRVRLPLWHWEVRFRP